MNFSVIATDTLKLVMTARSFFISMNSSMSGWSIDRMAMLAPRRVPPCLIAPVAASKTCMKLTGPLAFPFVVITMSFLGRSRLKAKPVLWIIARPDWPAA